MNFIKDGIYPITLQQIIQDLANKGTSVAQGFNPEDMGYEFVSATAQPTFDSNTRFAREIAPIKTDGKWLQQWEVVDLDAETIAAKQAQANEINNNAIKIQLAAIDARSIRALREGDQTRIAALEAEAATLRSQLK
jgi:hypothetical protein